jgi:hypothetical protein
MIKINRHAHDKKRSLVLVSLDELEQLEKLATQLVEVLKREQDAKDLKPVARHTHERLMQTIRSKSNNARTDQADAGARREADGHDPSTTQTGDEVGGVLQNSQIVDQADGPDPHG